MNKLMILGSAFLIFLVACSSTEITRRAETFTAIEDSPIDREGAVTESPIAQPPKEGSSWQTQELTDVRTQETFRIADFDTPVLLESFAVWCPTCTKQQRKISELHKAVGDALVSISVDTDPNENEDNIREHLQRNGFDWRYAVGPEDFTRSLIDEFGVGIVNAPSAPLVLICGNSVKTFGGGVKSVETLRSAIEGCDG